MTHKLLHNYYKIVRQSGLFKDYYSNYKDYNDAPLMGKRELIHQLNNNFDLRREKEGVYLVRSGGSTQKPLVFPVDIAENLQQRSVLATALKQVGIFTSTTIALNTFGYMDMYRTAAIIDDLLEKCNATTLVAGAALPHQDTYDMAQHFKPDLLMGTPSKLFLFAQHLKKHNLSLSIENLLFGGEFLPPAHIKVFEQLFGTRQIYSLYGAAETGIWAWCDYSRSASLFKVIEGLVVEVHEPDASGYGCLLVSNLYRKRFPIFRYNTGDIGRWVEIEGQLYLELKGRDRRSFMFNECNYELDDFNKILEDTERFQIQIVPQEGHTAIKFMLVTDTVNSDKDAYIEQKVKQLYEVFGYKVKSMEVIAEPEPPFYTDPVTGKTPAIIDYRI